LRPSFRAMSIFKTLSCLNLSVNSALCKKSCRCLLSLRPTKKVKRSFTPSAKKSKKPQWTSKNSKNSKNSKKTWAPLLSFFRKWKAMKKTINKKIFKFENRDWLIFLQNICFWIAYQRWWIRQFIYSVK
jgi:hypothetical protein